MKLKGKELYAYVAGIVDGEGSIIIKTANRHHSSTLMVCVVNTNLWLIKLLHMQFGGSIVKHSKFPPNRKPCYVWEIFSVQAIDFLKLISPYLQLKRPQAELALKFQARKGIRGKHISEEARILNEIDMHLMHSLNRRGTE